MWPFSRLPFVGKTCPSSAPNLRTAYGWGIDPALLRPVSLLSHTMISDLGAHYYSLRHTHQRPNRTWIPPNQRMVNTLFSTRLVRSASMFPHFSPCNHGITSATLPTSSLCFVDPGSIAGSYLGDNGGSVARAKACRRHEGGSRMCGFLYLGVTGWNKSAGRRRESGQSNGKKRYYS